MASPLNSDDMVSGNDALKSQECATAVPIAEVAHDSMAEHSLTQTPARVYDEAGVEKAIYDFLVAVGEDPQREGLRETPARVARAYREIFAGLHTDPNLALQTTFDIGHQELILVRDIPFYSVCEHHLLPFYGTAHVGYIPGADGRVTGLSKLARIVEAYARRPQIQERITTEVATALEQNLQVKGVIVVIEAEHMCMAMRGVQKPGSRTVTSAVRGVLRESASRAEAMSLIMQGK